MPQQLPDPVREPAGPDQRGGLPADAGHPPGGDREAGELAQHQRGPVNRDVVAGGQVRGLRGCLRPEAGPRPHVHRQPALGDRPAARALLRLRHVLGDPRRRRRLDVGHLVAALRHGRLAGQALPAPAARGRREEQPLVRVIDQAHRRPRLARLLPGPPFPPLPRRPVPALLLIRAVRRWRPRRRGRVPARLPLKILHPRLQDRDLRGQLLRLRRLHGDQPVRLSQPHRQLRMRQRSKILRGGTTGHVGHDRYSSPSRPARQPPATACRGKPGKPPQRTGITR